MDVASGKKLRSFDLAGVGDEDAREYRMHPRPALSPDGNVLAFAGSITLCISSTLVVARRHRREETAWHCLRWDLLRTAKHLWAQGAASPYANGTGLPAESRFHSLPVDTFRAALDSNAKYIITAPWDNSAGRIIRTSDGKEIGQIPPPR